VGQSRKALERYGHHVNLWDVNKRNGRQANDLPLKPKHCWLMELRERGMKPELIVLQTLAFKPETSGGTPRIVAEAERSWINRLLNASHPLTNSAHERATPVLAQERDAHILTNRLRADCVGQTLTLSINREKLLEVQDDAISTAGRVGVQAGGGTQDLPVLAQFDNFVLREP